MATNNDTNEASLKWTAQYSLLDGPHRNKLDGDRIVLPPSALEQLIAASTSKALSRAPDEFDQFGLSSISRDAQLQVQDSLPHPLIFRLVNPQNGNVAYCGVREFSADEGHMEVSQHIRDSLGLNPSEPEANSYLTIHAHALPKGSFARFRPLEAGYDPEDWKALLERHIRNTFTTLSSGQILTIPSFNGVYQFLIDKVLPDGDGICVVDTDLEVDIEPLNEEQARETLKQQQAKAQRARESSSGGAISPGSTTDGLVAPGAYVDYTVKDWDHKKPLNVSIQISDGGGVDLYISPFGPRQRSKPRIDEHLFEEISNKQFKRLRVEPTNVELEGAEAVLIGVHGNVSSDNPQNSPYAFTIKVESGHQTKDNIQVHTADIHNPDDGDVQCQNCKQWVPGGRLFLHENFCLRNNIRCPQCDQVFQKSSDEWKNHWHCELDPEHGNSAASKLKHNQFYHVPTSCKGCGEDFRSLGALARHRITSCPDKQILCQFCHLLVPQRGPDDPEFTDPQVILSGLTPHEVSDGARTTECHMCNKIVRFRDMTTHLKHHDFERLSRPTPRLCRNENCGRTLDGVGTNGQIKPPQVSRNDIGLCDTCFGPLYNSTYDPEHKALKRRLERKYLTQLITGCGQSSCRNSFCKNGRFQSGMMEPGQTINSKEAITLIRPELENLLKFDTPLHLCADETSQQRRTLAEMLAAETSTGTKGSGYSLAWSIAALEAEHGDLTKSRMWLANWAPTKAEERG